MIIHLPDLTKPELNHICELANFTEREEELFWLRAGGTTHEECAEIMNFSDSTIKRTNKKMIAKIMRVI